MAHVRELAKQDHPARFRPGEMDYLARGSTGTVTVVIVDRRFDVDEGWTYYVRDPDTNLGLPGRHKENLLSTTKNTAQDTLRSGVGKGGSKKVKIGTPKVEPSEAGDESAHGLSSSLLRDAKMVAPTAEPKEAEEAIVRLHQRQ